MGVRGAAHNCGPECRHWCEKSPTKRHRWIIDPKSTPSAQGHCRHCGMARNFRGGVGKHAITAAEMNAQAEEQAMTLTSRGGYAQT